MLSFKTFTELNWNCYKVLRKNADTLVTLLRIMLCCGIPELYEKSIRMKLIKIIILILLNFLF